MKQGLSNNAKGIIFALITQAIWSFSILFTKMLTNEYTWSEIISWRFNIGIAFFAFLMLIGVLKVDFKSKRKKPLIVMAIFHPMLYFIGETYGIAETTASESGIFIAIIPVVTLVMTIFLFARKPKAIQVVGIVLSLTGIIVMIGLKGERSYNLFGYSMLVLAVFSSCMYFTLSDKYTEYTSTEKSFIVNFAGSMFFSSWVVIEKLTTGESVVNWLTLPVTNLGFLAGTAYLGVGCSVVAYLSINSSIRYIGAERTTSFANVTTAVTVIGSVLMLGEHLTFAQVVGVIFVIVGVYLANKASGDKAITDLLYSASKDSCRL